MFVVVQGNVVADLGNVLALDVIHGGVEQQPLHGEGQDFNGVAPHQVLVAVNAGLESLQSLAEEVAKLARVVVEHPVVGRGGQHGAVKAEGVALEQGVKRFDRIQVWLDQRGRKQEIDDNEIL